MRLNAKKFKCEDIVDREDIVEHKIYVIIVFDVRHNFLFEYVETLTTCMFLDRIIAICVYEVFLKSEEIFVFV